MTTQTPATVEIEKWLRVSFFTNFWLRDQIRVRKENAGSCWSHSGNPDPVPPLHVAEVWTDWILDFLDRTLAASSRIRSEVFFAEAELDMNFVFADNTFVVLHLTYIYAESNRSRIACVYRVRSGFGL